MNGRVVQLGTDPVPRLLASTDAALGFFVRRDLLADAAGPVEQLWELPGARAILRKQQEDGSWRYPGQQRELHPETFGNARAVLHLFERMRALHAQRVLPLLRDTPENELPALLNTMIPSDVPAPKLAQADFFA